MNAFFLFFDDPILCATLFTSSVVLAAFEQNNVEESKNAHKAKQAGEINESGHGG